MITDDDLATYSKRNKIFWPHATVTNTYSRLANGCKKYRLKYDLLFGPKKFIRMRKYKGPGGETRRTVEIEI